MTNKRDLCPINKPNRFRFRIWNNEFNKIDFSEGISLDELADAEFYPLEKPNGIWMQSTGLLDKNGKEIFEGDVLKTPFTDKYSLVIKWINCSDCTVGFHGVWSNQLDHIEKEQYYNGLTLSSLKVRLFEVMGNKYENPELLEQ